MTDTKNAGKQPDEKDTTAPHTEKLGRSAAKKKSK
ncbi:MAG: hypothetical protein K0Q90_3145 [Paenibacillaceae bacterium]|jgi:hypothetical protein|nr:hypothetical protein [Paenibacillaceae bacterium]